MEEARQLVEQTHNPVAAYHLARQYEDQGQAREAIHYFTIAQSYRHAIAIAKEQDMVCPLFSQPFIELEVTTGITSASFTRVSGSQQRVQQPRFLSTLPVFGLGNICDSRSSGCSTSNPHRTYV